jgi:hypothetical protein
MLPTLWRYAALKENGYVNSRADLRNKQEKQGFPAGRMIGANQRAWTSEEVFAWWESRSSAGPALRGAAKALRGRKAGTEAAKPPRNREAGTEGAKEQI